MLGVPIAFDAHTALLVIAVSILFAALGSLYPVFHGVRLSPIEAMRRIT